MATPANLGRVAEKAEALGYDTVWFSDHIVIPTEVKSFYPYDPSGKMPFNPSEPYWEPLTVIGYVAARTSRLRLGTSVLDSALPQSDRDGENARHPRRSVQWTHHLGAGVGWMAEEFKAIGLDTYSHRGAYSDECIRIFRELWTRDNPAFQGEFHQFSNIRCEPRPSAAGRHPHLDRWSYAAGHPARGPAGRWLATTRPASAGRTYRLPKCRRKSPNCEPLPSRLAATQHITLATGSSIQFTDGAATGPRSLFTGTPAQIGETLRRYQELGIQNFRCDFPSSLY